MQTIQYTTKRFSDFPLVQQSKCLTRTVIAERPATCSLRSLASVVLCPPRFVAAHALLLQSSSFMRVHTVEQVYLKKYKLGQIVDVRGDGGVQKGMPHKFYHGKTGIVWNVTKRAIGVQVSFSAFIILSCRRYYSVSVLTVVVCSRCRSTNKSAIVSSPNASTSALSTSTTPSAVKTSLTVSNRTMLSVPKPRRTAVSVLVGLQIMHYLWIDVAGVLPGCVCCAQPDDKER